MTSSFGIRRGYRLALAPDDIDVHRLEGLVQAGRDAGLDGDHRRSLTLFEQAVALHRGDPLAALTDFPFAQTAAAHVTQVLIEAHFHLVHLALAVAEVAAGDPFEVPPPAGRLTRGERQHAEIVSCHLADDVGRGQDLRREHLLEFPGDLLIVWLPASRRPTPAR